MSSRQNGPLQTILKMADDSHGQARLHFNPMQQQKSPELGNTTLIT
jgi:hypothetical protein